MAGIEDIRGQRKFVDDANYWIEKNDMPNVLIYGMGGTGKTTAAKINFILFFIN